MWTGFVILTIFHKRSRLRLNRIEKGLLVGYKELGERSGRLIFKVKPEMGLLRKCLLDFKSLNEVKKRSGD